MRVVGGGQSRDEIETYTPEQIQAFNYAGLSTVSAVWVPNKTDTPRVPHNDKEYLLTSGVSEIFWACRMYADI